MKTSILFFLTSNFLENWVLFFGIYPPLQSHMFQEGLDWSKPIMVVSWPWPCNRNMMKLCPTNQGGSMWRLLEKDVLAFKNRSACRKRKLLLLLEIVTYVCDVWNFSSHLVIMKEMSLRTELVNWGWQSRKRKKKQTNLNSWWYLWATGCTNFETTLTWTWEENLINYHFY